MECRMKNMERKKNLAAKLNPAELSADFMSIPSNITAEWMQQQLTVTPAELAAFEQGLVQDFAEANFNDLFGSCRQKVIESIVNPLGLGKFMAMYDRVGGNVDTIHNARQIGEDGKPIGTEKFKSRYDEFVESEQYDHEQSVRYHSDNAYTESNRVLAKQKDKGTLNDAYSDENIGQNQKIDQDHIIAAKTIQNDPGRLLSKLDGVQLANADGNLVGTDRSINRSKGAKSTAEFVAWLEASREKRQATIAELKNRPELTEKEQKKLKKLEALESVDPQLMLEHGKKAEKEYNSKINKTYYGSAEFWGDTGKTSAVAGAKMGFQQALGFLLVDVSNALFDEIIESYRHGFMESVEADDKVDALKKRLKRVAKTACDNWKKIVVAFKDGAISGVLSNIITTLINTFLTTAKNIVRIIREGTFVLYRATKLLLFPPPDMSLTDVWDAVLRLIVAGAFTLGGIALEEAVAKVLTGVPIIAPIAGTLSVILVGILTGVSAAAALYGIDKWDPFGARDLKKRSHIRKQLEEKKDFHMANLDALCKVFDIA